MNRVDLLPDNYVDTFLSQLETEADELKNSLQRTGGSSLIYKQSDTGATNDWSGILTHGGGAQPYFQKFLITAVASTQSVVLADLVWYIWVNGVQKTNFDANLYTLASLPKVSSTTNTQQWFVNVSWTNNTDTIAVKAYILATDNVTITVQAL